MVAKLVVLIFATFFIQDAVFSEQVLSDTARAQDDRVAVKADQQNLGKIWNWTFGNSSPAANEGTLKTPSDANSLPANDSDFKLEKSPSQRTSQVAHAMSAVAAADFDGPFQKESHFSASKRNPVNFRNQFNNKLNKKYESEEYDFDDSYDDDDDDSYDSQSGSSQSYDDEDDFSPENKYPAPPNARARNQQYPARFPVNRRGPKTVPEMERPAMQTRSLQMRKLRGRSRRYGSVSM